MLYREVIAVCSEMHTEHITTLCGQNVELLNVKTCGTISNHWAFKSLNASLTAFQYADFLLPTTPDCFSAQSPTSRCITAYVPCILRK
jgi:hypothetical protein